MVVSFLFEGLKNILSIPLPESDPKYQSGVWVLRNVCVELHGTAKPRIRV